MKTSSKSKILITLFLSLGVLISAFSGIFFFALNKKGTGVYAAGETIEKPVVVSKVKATKGTADNKNIYKFATNEKDIVLLKENAVQTSDSENNPLTYDELLLLNTNSENTEKEIMLVTFNVDSLKYDSEGNLTLGKTLTGKQYIQLNVNAFLNGKQLLTNETINESNSSSNRYFFQILDLDTNSKNPLKYKDGTEVSDTEGHYKFIFNFSTKEGNTVETGLTQTVEFYAFNAETYQSVIKVTNDSTTIDKTNSIKVEPRLFNTEKIDRSYFSTSTEKNDGVEYNYFNYNNNSTTDYFAENVTNNKKVLFPQISYDITKYNIKYRHALYGIYSNYQVLFEGFKNGEPVLSLIKDDVTYSAKVITDGNMLTYSFVNNGENLINDIVVEKKDGHYIATVKFTDIGEYDYMFNYVVENKQYNERTNSFTSTYLINSLNSTTYDEATFVKRENWNRLGDSKMYVYGYQLFHSDYSNSTVSNDKEFRHGDELITDFSFKNNKDSFKENEADLNKNDMNIDNFEICSTNQAPVTIKYYGAMTTKNNKTKSYYKYWNSIEAFKKYITLTDDQKKEKENQKFLPTLFKNITNDTRFTKDGYYQVFIEYNFTNYKKLKTLESGKIELDTDAPTTAHYQFFSFSINNSEPNIEVKADSTDVNSNGYTNKSVDVSWSANTVFDIAPRVRVLKHLFDNQNDSWIEVYNDNKANVTSQGITYTNEGTEKIKINKEFNGLYQVIINYGPGKNTVVKYRFNIDTTPISNLKTYEVLSLNNESNQITYEDSTRNVLSGSFALDWSEKQSGAKISATYNFIPLEESVNNTDDDNISLLNEFLNSSKNTTVINKDLTDKISGKTINLENGYTLKTINENLPYSKAVITTKTEKDITTSTLNNIESLKTSAGFYLFTITDEAGNQSYKTIFVDNTKALVYKFIEEENGFTSMVDQNNIASRNSIVVWGNNKKITIDESIQENLYKFINNNAKESDNYLLDKTITTDPEGNVTSTTLNSLLVKIDEAVIQDDSSTVNKRYTNTITTSKSYQDFYIKYTKNQNDELDNATDKQVVIDKYWNYGEHIHNITFFDQSLISLVKDEIKNNTENVNDIYNQVNNTTQNVKIEMNSDNSMLMFYLTDSAGKYNRVLDSGISNYNKLYFEWLPNLDTDYEVSSIKYYFFPLAFEDGDNYPYSSTPQLVEEIDLTSTTASTVNASKIMSGAINTQSGAQSIEGMYLVKREYKNPIESSSIDNKSGDYSPRYYLFFVDRNKVISYTSSLQLLGEKIGFNIGYDRDNYQIKFSGSDFLMDSSAKNLKFTTSKLPVEFIEEVQNLNKFDSLNKEIEPKSNNIKLDNIETNYNISKTILNSFKLNSAKIEYKASEQNKYAVATDEDTINFRKNGYYQITLSDKTHTRDNNLNDYVFTFKIDVESPRAQVAKYELNGDVLEVVTYDEEEQNISTNKQNMLVVWNKPINNTGYDAEIDTKNFKIDITTENGKSVSLTVRNGKLSASGTTLPTQSNITVHDISTDQLKEQSNFYNPTWDYYIDFADILAILPSEFSSQSAKFAITLQYIGEESDYSGLTNELPNKFFYTIKNVVFDFKKPEYNISRLLLSDAYLANYYSDLDENTSLLSKFYDLNSEINYENYAFTVDKNFTLDYATVNSSSIWSDKNMDTYKMFMRRYDKYNDEKREDQQSLTPDDPRCNDSIYAATRLKFDENYKLNGSQVYTNISNYYWDNNEHKDYNLGYIINELFDNNYDCFYEIIEVDYAGNYRIYTIYVKSNDISINDGDSSASFELSEEGSTPTQRDATFKNIQRYTVSNQNSNQIELVDASTINYDSYSYIKMYSCNYNLKEISPSKQYITVKVEDINGKTTNVLTLSPNGDKQAFIDDLNELYSAYNKASGNIYYITFISSMGEILKIEHRKPSEAYPNYSITRGDTGFTVTFTVSINDVNSSSYFTNFNAYRAENGTMIETSLDTDSNGKTIVKNIEEYLTNNNLTTATFSYTFKMQGSSGSEYYLIFEDNFDRELKLREIVGVEDNDDKIVFNSPSQNLLTVTAYDSADITKPIDLIYSNNSAFFKFQNVLYTPKLYKMTMEKIGDKYILKKTDDSEVQLDNDLFVKDINGIWTYPLNWIEGEENIIYKVEFVSTQGSIFYYVGYHNSISEIYVIKPADSQSGNLKILVKDQDVNVFDREVYINISDEDSLFPVVVTATRTYLDQNGEVTLEDLGVISNNQTLSKLGSYTFTAQNILGTKITFFVKLEEKISRNYWVAHYINGIDNGALVPVSQDRNNQYEYGKNVNNPIKYFTIYEFEVKTDTANNYRFELIKEPEETKFNQMTVASTYSYKIYQRVVQDGETVENDVTYITVTKVVANNNFLKNYDNQLLINDIPRTASVVTITQDEENKSKSAILSVEKTFNIIAGNDIIMTITYNSQFLREVNLSTATTADLTFEDSGIYQFTFRDVAGNRQVFDRNNQYFQMALINDVIFTINGSPAVNNSVFNENVVLALQNLDKFTGSITVISKLNGKQIVVKSINNSYTYTDFGFYEITLSGEVKKGSGEEKTNVTTVFKFRIVNINEAMATFEYIGLNNYEITKIEKLNNKTDEQGIDITDSIRNELNVYNLNNIALSSLENGLGGAGYYRITVNARYSINKPEQSFTFDVWLNNDFDVLIKCSIKFGSSTTKSINLTLNKKQIYNKVGDCVIYFNDTEWLVINEETALENLTEVFTITQNGTFNVRLVTKSGNTLESFVITKKEPLNAIAIIVIIISVIAVVAVVIIFIKLRKNMKVK